MMQHIETILKKVIWKVWKALIIWQDTLKVSTLLKTQNDNQARQWLQEM